MDLGPHKITPKDKCDSQRKIPSKYAKVTQDVIKWLMFKDYPKENKPRQEVLDCLHKPETTTTSTNLIPLKT